MPIQHFFRCVLVTSLLLAVIALNVQSSSAGTVTGSKNVVVLRVYFHDYANTSRYTQAQVQGFFTQLNTLWGTNSSYGNISLSAQVSSLFQLPSNRSTYIDTPPDVGGDLSSGGRYMQVLNDAVANSPAGINWNNVDAVVVIMAETDATKFHRGQGNKCNLPMGPGSSNTPLVGCAIFSENPGSTDVEVWGRWAHELGHAFQAGGPPHPSNYNSNFEQMDANYPGQTGVFEKQSSTAFGWMPDSKYFVVTPAMGGASRGIYAEEYNPASKPNAQAIKAYISGIGSAYYLISVRRRVLGDDLNDVFSPAGIPDEGVLIERVTENGDPWVTLQGNGGDRDKLWHEGQTFTNTNDGIFIDVSKKFDADDYLVTVRYADQSQRPDVGINSWLEPPGNTYETTDIWVDSPVNGYGTYRFGTWSDLMGGTVPQGNGDDPAIGQVNRLYARIRNYGTISATNVVVHFDVTSPLGLGINGSNGFVLLGTVTSAEFPGLASIPPGGSTDVYINWTPTATLTPQQLAAGIFYFHSCVRVRIDHLPGETIFGNQDGNGQQENIDYFQAPAAGGGGPGAPYKTIIHLRNDDTVHSKFFNLGYERAQVPPGWKVVVNGGLLGLQLGPNEVRDIPVAIIPAVPMPLGKSASVVVFASSLRLLTSDKNPNDKHPDFHTLGGVRVEGHAVARTKLGCVARRTADGVVFKGRLAVASPGKLDTSVPIFLEGVSADGQFLTHESSHARLMPDGSFTGVVPQATFKRGICMFAGTSTEASATSGYIKVQ
ncbi:MAG TPA: hypothetical protein VG488_11310 [Candidatus Angelobacter sp.]|jgi:hypothetical protein|nr:hypothetical protein [Candidatus Angelobacter sp.]